MKRSLLPPILVIALASMLMASANPTTAEPMLVVPAPEPLAAPGRVVDVLRFFLPTAVFVGQTPAGMGYVLTSEKRGYFIRPQPGGIVQVIPAEPKAVKDLAKLSGWRL